MFKHHELKKIYIHYYSVLFIVQHTALGKKTANCVVVIIRGRAEVDVANTPIEAIQLKEYT